MGPVFVTPSPASQIAIPPQHERDDQRDDAAPTRDVHPAVARRPLAPPQAGQVSPPAPALRSRIPPDHPHVQAQTAEAPALARRTVGAEPAITVLAIARGVHPPAAASLVSQAGSEALSLMPSSFLEF